MALQYSSNIYLARLDLVESSKSWREIWLDVKKKIAGGVALAVIVFFWWAIWSEIKRRAQQ